MNERITALEAEIEAAQEAISTASLIAATESTSPADRLKKARAILEQRELLKLARLELVEARKQERAKAEEDAHAERCANLARMRATHGARCLEVQWTGAAMPAD